MVKSVPVAEGTPIIKGYDFNTGRDLDGIMAAAMTTGFQVPWLVLGVISFFWNQRDVGAGRAGPCVLLQLLPSVDCIPPPRVPQIMHWITYHDGYIPPRPEQAKPVLGKPRWRQPMPSSRKCSLPAVEPPPLDRLRLKCRTHEHPPSVPRGRQQSPSVLRGRQTGKHRGEINHLHTAVAMPMNSHATSPYLQRPVETSCI